MIWEAETRAELEKRCLQSLVIPPLGSKPAGSGFLEEMQASYQKLAGLE